MLYACVVLLGNTTYKVWYIESIWCRHLDIISDLLFNNVDLSVERIMSLSIKQRSHRLDKLEYAGALLNISQLVPKLLRSRLSLQIYLDSSVRFSYLSCLKSTKWFAYRCLNGVSVEPIYTFGAEVPPASTVALYITPLVKHFPLRGHRSGFRQLQLLDWSSFSCCVLHTRVLWRLIMDPMLVMQM